MATRKAEELMGRIWEYAPGSQGSFYKDLAEDLLDRCEQAGVNVEDILDILESKYLGE